MKRTDCEIINHGHCLSDYFQGCGVSFTGFSEVVTGCGKNAKEAYEDACEQAHQGFNNLSLPSRPRGINAKDKVPAAANEDCYCYVSIRFNP